MTAVGPSLRRIGAKLDRRLAGAMDHEPARVPAAHADAELHVRRGAGDADRRLPPGDDEGPERRVAGAGSRGSARRSSDAGGAGKELVDSLGCRACHALSPDEVAGQLGANKDIAPNLSNIAEKTGPRWMYAGCGTRAHCSDGRPDAEPAPVRRRGRGDHGVSRHARREEAGSRRPRGAARDPDNIAAGEKLVRKYGCAGCHDIPGMENESRVGAELSAFGRKTKEELFFGDRTDVHETWDDWTFNKLKTPRTYATHWIEQVMPQFDLADEDIKALRVFLAESHRREGAAKYAFHGPGDRPDRHGTRTDRALQLHRLPRDRRAAAVTSDGSTRSTPTLAPPILNGEGEKVQAAWLFNFVKAPVADPALAQAPHADLRPRRRRGQRGRRATSGRSTEVQSRTSTSISRALSPENVDAGKQLTSKDVLRLLLLPPERRQKPQGPPEGWAPDLALARAAAQPGVDRQVAPRPAEGDARHEDAVVLRRPGGTAARQTSSAATTTRRSRRCATTSCRSGCRAARPRVTDAGRGCYAAPRRGPHAHQGGEYDAEDSVRDGHSPSRCWRRGRRPCGGVRGDRGHRRRHACRGR